MFIIISLLLLITNIEAQEKLKPPEPKKKDKCPVCAMFVIDYPQWWCVALFENNRASFFDGSKCMFKYYLRPELYGTGKKSKPSALYVRDYYTLKWINAKDAFYVIDSDVYGPMGHELIPLSSEEDAIEFKHDHNGSAILRFDDVTWELLIRLSEGQDM